MPIARGQGCRMQPLKSVVGDVERAVASGEDNQRVETLRRVTDLFIQQAPALKDEHLRIYDEVILRLAHKIQFRARIELAERLADVANAPLSTVRHLAFDENVEVAGPVIERSPRLEEGDLLRIARERGQGHLFAMAKRPNLTENVTDVLVVRGDQTVLRTVANNHTAKFSDSGFGTLVRRSEADTELQDILEQRSDMPQRHLDALVALAKERAKEELRDLCDSGCDEQLSSVVDSSAEGISLGVGPVVMLADAIAAANRIADIANRGLLAEDQVVRMVKEGKIPDALAAIAKLSHLPLEVVVNAYGAPHYDQMLFLFRSMRFGWPTFKIFLSTKFGEALPEALLKTAFSSFEALSVPTAQRVMRFVNTRTKLAAAAQAQ